MISSVILDDKKGSHSYKTCVLKPTPEWVEELADAYIALRTYSQNELSNISLDGITVLEVNDIKTYLGKACIPKVRGDQFDVMRSDFGELLAYSILEKKYSTRIGYKGIRDRELTDMPGRGMDVVGVEINAPLKLILGEVKVSAENKTPPQVVDKGKDSLSKKLKSHITNHDETSRKLWDVARKTVDPDLQKHLICLALYWSEKSWEKFNVVCCAILIRNGISYKETDFGNLRCKPDLLEPGLLRFMIVCTPDDLDTVVKKWCEVVKRKVDAL